MREKTTEITVLDMGQAGAQILPWQRLPALWAQSPQRDTETLRTYKAVLKREELVHMLSAHRLLHTKRC